MSMTGQPGAGVVDMNMSADLATAALDLARRFRHGATLWVLAPQWEPHAHHVAVEFVHPVVVGKRALPAVALVGPDLVAQARLACRRGDVLMAVAAADESAVVDTMRRAPAWGALTLWVGTGPRPVPGAANHVLWIDSLDPMVPANGSFMLLYHLLWELTQVCFEHPGLLTDRGDDGAGASCVTCGDEGRLAEIVLVPDGPMGLALIRSADGEEWVDVSMLDQVAVNDLILVHAGAAIASLDAIAVEADR
ncbi:MAG: hydrogenase assembly protein HupF [Mycobacteriaceae bacterium]|nr:hydrogenase assembly protein HupF [Mycobacteriaceae bacterium]